MATEDQFIRLLGDRKCSTRYKQRARLLTRDISPIPNTGPHWHSAVSHEQPRRAAYDLQERVPRDARPGCLPDSVGAHL